jgi:hypothetical protein
MLLVCRQFSTQGPTKNRRSSRYLFGKNREQATCSKEECRPSRCNGCSFRFHCSGTTIRAIFTTVLTQYIPVWWGNFTNTWRWFRMRTRGSFFRLMFRATCFRLILRWSMILSMFQSYPFQPVHSQRTWSSLHWSNSESTFMPIHRAMSVHMPLSRSMPFLPHTNCLQKLCYTIYGPHLVGVSLFWRGPNSYMLSVEGCLFAYVSTSKIWCWRWEMSTLPGSLLHVWSPGLLLSQG